jgi:hypothetical protein
MVADDDQCVTIPKSSVKVSSGGELRDLYDYHCRHHFWPQYVGRNQFDASSFYNRCCSNAGGVAPRFW